MDWAEACRILGVKESAVDAEIKDQYVYKAHLLHPDKNLDKPETIRKRAEAELALVNQAYSFLTNPNNNPYKVPPKLSVEPVKVRFKDVNIGGKKNTTLIIRNIGGPYTSIWIDNNPAPWLAVTGVKSVTSERLPLEVALECTGAGEPDKLYSCDLTIKLENENTHSVDRAIVRIELNTVAESVQSDINKRVISQLKNQPAEASLNRAASGQMQENRLGFSLGAFLLNLLGFAALGVVAVYLINIFLQPVELFFMIGLIVYITAAFGISLNHGITVGSRASKNGAKDRKPDKPV